MAVWLREPAARTEPWLGRLFVHSDLAALEPWAPAAARDDGSILGETAEAHLGAQHDGDSVLRRGVRRVESESESERGEQTTARARGAALRESGELHYTEQMERERV